MTWHFPISSWMTIKKEDQSPLIPPYTPLITFVAGTPYWLKAQPNTRCHDDVIKWKNFPCYRPFVWGIHRSPVNHPHKGQWRGALMFYLICARINGWVNNREAGDLKRHRTDYDVIVMWRHQQLLGELSELRLVFHVRRIQWVQRINSELETTDFILMIFWQYQWKPCITEGYHYIYQQFADADEAFSAEVDRIWQCCTGLIASNRAHYGLVMVFIFAHYTVPLCRCIWTSKCLSGTFCWVCV